jgi:hypothetical protein
MRCDRFRMNALHFHDAGGGDDDDFDDDDNSIFFWMG